MPPYQPYEPKEVAMALLQYSPYVIMVIIT